MDSQALGALLRQAREAKELTLEDAEQTLRIRRRILEGFELGEFLVPEFSAVQIRGFIRNYATYLGLDEERVLVMFEQALVGDERRARKGKGGAQARSGTTLSGRKRDTGETPAAPALSAAPIAPPAPSRVMVDARRSTGETARIYAPSLPPAKPRRSLLRALLSLLVGVAALAIIGFVGFQLLQPPPAGVIPTETPLPTPIGIINSLPPTATPTPLPTEIQIFLPTPTAPLQPSFTGQGVFVTINITQRTWLRLISDGAEVYVGVAPPGTRLEYGASDSIALTASNAAALDVIYNGAQQGAMGMRGQRVDLTFSATGAQISSAPGFAPTPIMSETPLPTPTDPNGAVVALLTMTLDAGGEAPLGVFTPTTDPLVVGAIAETPLSAETLLAMPLPGDPTLSPTPLPLLLTPTNPPAEVGAPTPLPLPGMATAAPTNPPEPTLPPTNTPEPTLPPTLTPSTQPTRTLPPTLTPSTQPTRTLPPTLTPSTQPTRTLPPTLTPSTQPTRTLPPTPTATFTPSPSATPAAILPPRYTPTDPTPTKTR